MKYLAAIIIILLGYNLFNSKSESKKKDSDKSQYLIENKSYRNKPKCADFATQQEAQIYMETYQAYRLDRDRDGEACECLPGGSKYGKKVCRKYKK